MCMPIIPNNYLNNMLFCDTCFWDSEKYNVTPVIPVSGFYSQHS